MSVYDFLENPQDWRLCEDVAPRLINNPQRSFIHFWMPKQIEQRLYAKNMFITNEENRVDWGTIHLWVGKVGSHYVIEAAAGEFE